MDHYLKANQQLWDQRVPYHVQSPFYHVARFQAGGSRLDPVVLDVVGDVHGQALLHLQCHFGLDTLAWARRGAIVTGTDFASAGINAARTLASDAGLAATFVCCNLYDLPQHLSGQFDVIFTSHGVLSWLPDLSGWAQVIAHFLKPGGRFVIVEMHPFVLMFDEHRDDTALQLRYPYFPHATPLRWEEQGSYAAPEAPIRGVSYTWNHSLAEIFSALLAAGLTIDAFTEYPYMAWAFFPWMERRDDGYWQLPSAQTGMPLMFSLQAHKPAPPYATAQDRL